MASPATPRPVSGEIMTGPGILPPQARPFGDADVLDAEYVTLDAPERAHVPHRFSASAHGGASAGIGMLRRGGRQSAPTRMARGGPAFWLIGLLLAGGAFWVSGGHVMFDKAPISIWARGTSDPLRLEGVRTRVEARDGRPVLFVDGKILNPGAEERNAPPLAMEVVGRSGRVAHYNLGTSGGRIGPGGSFAFSGWFDAPMEGVETVSVSFREN